MTDQNDATPGANAFVGLPMSELVGGPLRAANDAQVRIANATADFINMLTRPAPPPFPPVQTGAGGINISEAFTSLPMGDLIGGPLTATINETGRLPTATASLLIQIGGLTAPPPKAED